MIFKTLLSLASAAFLAATATASSHDALPVQTFDSSEQLSRDLQPSAEANFVITPGAVSTTASTLTLSYTNGAGDGGSPPGGRFDIFTLTSSGPITDSDLTDVDADPTLSCFSKRGSNFVYASWTSGITGVSTIGASASTFAISFNENATATQPYYSATGPSTALIVKYFLCVKFTLTKDIGSGPAVETDINYRETALEVTLTLNGTIANATAFTVDTLDPGTDINATITYTVSAGLCPTFLNNIGTTPVTQGLTVPICIVSDQFPLASINSIDRLTFTSGIVVQNIIATGGGAAPGADGLYGIAPANGECLANQCIHVDVIVYAIFANEAATNLIVAISGDAVMSVGRVARKLRVNVQPTRELQETIQMQAFRSEITLPALAAPDSAATLTSVCAAAVPFAVAMAGALAL